MAVLAVCNETTDNLGFIGERFDAHNLGPVTTVYREDPAAWPEPTDFDLLVSTGSLWSVTEDERAAALRHEVELYRRALTGAVPILAICYGAHALALALGAPGRPAPQPEAGFVVPDTADPTLVPAGPWLTWHSDLLTVPTGATLLARTPVAPQAWTLGRSMAVQFHAELTPSELASWVARGADWLHEHHIDPHALIAEAEAHAQALRARAHTLFDAFWTRLAQAPEN
ncbi:aminotransferase [Streptomyces sp. NPDC057798]|uniref:glutamine amidotransferase-related protein n=1 Tax=Streptomyces sp. NPDC057798 TaxID=3346252 RepID=UPI003690C222